MSQTVKNPLVIVTRRLPETIEARMMELFETRLNEDDHVFSREELRDSMAEAEILVPTVTDQIDKSLIENAGNGLKLIASFGTGTDHIDISSAGERKIIVTNTPGVLTEDTADMTMALILAVSRRLAEGERMMRTGKWEGWAPTALLGHRIWGKRLGIVGMGRIGQAVARRARGFGLSIHYHNRHLLPEGFESELEVTYWESLDQMLARMDFISIHCPSTPATYHLLSARRLRLIQKGAYVINTSRGHAIDEAELTRLLEAGDIAGAGLDVYEHEPIINSKLLSLENTVLLPHIGSATLEGRIDMGEKVLINIQTFVDGHSPPDRVLPN